MFVFLFPLQKHLYLVLFVLVQIWTIFIHDSDMISGSWWEEYINSPAHHSKFLILPIPSYVFLPYQESFWSYDHFSSYIIVLPFLSFLLLIPLPQREIFPFSRYPVELVLTISFLAIHHLTFTSNFGQYFVWADKFWNSHREPQDHLDPIHEALRIMREKGLIDEKGNPIEQKEKKKDIWWHPYLASI